MPQGTISEYIWESSLFQGTRRKYWIYVPAQYDSAKGAAIMVFQDGQHYLRDDGDFRVPIVFDNLIHEGSMPPTIGLFVNPGHKGDTDENLEDPFRANNRSFEYDRMGDHTC